MDAQNLNARSTMSTSTAVTAKSPVRTKLKQLPFVRPALSLVRRLLDFPSAFKRQWRFARHVRSVIGRTDALLISGSNQFLDNFGGPMAFPYTLWLWTRYAKQRGIPVLVLSVGAGPIFSRLSMRLIRGTIARVDYLSFRDSGSPAAVGLDPASTNVVPDLAFSHQSEAVRDALHRDFSLSSAPVVAINPMAVHARGYWYKVDDRKYKAYVDKLSRLVQVLESAGNEFIFISNQPRDDLVIRDIISAAVAGGCSGPALEARFLASTNVEEYLRNASRADIIIATRFHANVLGLLLARPIIGLCYHRKSGELLKEFSLGDFAFDIDKFSVDDVMKSISELSNTYEIHASGIAKKALDYRMQLDKQYEKIKQTIAARTIG